MLSFCRAWTHSKCIRSLVQCAPSHVPSSIRLRAAFNVNGVTREEHDGSFHFYITGVLAGRNGTNAAVAKLSLYIFTHCASVLSVWYNVQMAPPCLPARSLLSVRHTRARSTHWLGQRLPSIFLSGRLAPVRHVSLANATHGKPRNGARLATRSKRTFCGQLKRMMGTGFCDACVWRPSVARSAVDVLVAAVQQRAVVDPLAPPHGRERVRVPLPGPGERRGVDPTVAVALRHVERPAVGL